MSQTQTPKSKAIWLISSLLGFVIMTFLVWWLYFKPTATTSYSWVYFLPYLNCSLNAATTCLLILGYKAIKGGNKSLHQTCMITAGTVSALFLISYLTYHHFVGDTRFLGQGWVRPLYFSILISHILLSMIQVPCILATFFFAFTKNWSSHKKAAKLTFPIWLYVSVTGVIIFIFLKSFS